MSIINKVFKSFAVTSIKYFSLVPSQVENSNSPTTFLYCIYITLNGKTSITQCAKVVFAVLLLSCTNFFSTMFMLQNIKLEQIRENGGAYIYK